MKNILPYSFMHIIDRHSVFCSITKLNLLNQDVNIRLYYIYKFSNKKANDIPPNLFIKDDFEYQLKFRVLIPKSGFSIQLINFIKDKDLNLLSSIDEETLAFILKALIFGEVNKTIISGLTKETILPFYAIAIQNWEKSYKHYNNHIFDDEQNKNLFLETLKSMMNNQSIIIVESIKSILNSFEKGKLINNFLDVKYKVIEILIESILIKSYNQNKTFITSYLASNIDCLKYVKSNLNDLIDYYTKEKDLESILFIEKIQNRYDYFKENHLIKIPLEYFDGKTLKDFFPILEYKLANENKYSINDFIFNKLINNTLLRKCYLITRLQSYDNNNSITMNNLFIHAKSDYSNYTNDFLNVFNSVYMYNITKQKFIKKSGFTDDYFQSEFEIGRIIIDYLFHLIEQNQMKNKAFYCLKNIACSFLFLFDQNPNQIFEVVLPELENYSIIFDDKIGNGIKETKTKAKTAICALSFLISSLHSNKVIDAFINWYFTNIKKFSDIQNYCFNYIFLLTLKTNGLKRTIVASLLKYDYYEIILKLMKKDIENVIFRNNYNKLFHLILCELAILFNKFNEFDILAIDELKKMNSPFCFDFNNYITFLPLTIKQMMPEEIFSNIPQTELQQKLFDYMKNIEYNRYFWLNYKNKNVEADFYTNTYKSFNNNTCFQRIDLNIDLDLKEPISINFGRYIFQKSSWLYQCFSKNQNISLYQDEFDIFTQALNKSNEYQNDDIITRIDKCSLFQKYCCEDYIFDISNLASLSDNDFAYICKLVAKIINTKEDRLSSLNLLAINFDIIYENDIKEEKEFNYFSRFLSILVEISNLDDFKQKFISDFERDLFYIVLQPQYRNNEEILSKLADILINVDLPDVLFCYEHAFEFMFLTNNDDVIYKAAKLSSKYMNELIPKYNQKIRKCFCSLIKKTPLPLSKIIELIKIDSSLADFYMNTILLDKLFNIDLSNNPNKNLIIQLINLLTPNITDYDVNIFTDNKDLEINQNPPVPLSLLDINPIFWNYFIENRNKINKIIEDNNLTYFNDNYVSDGDNSMISLTLFNHYPQLFSFAFKCKLFYGKINKEVHFDQTLNLLIDTENIVESSFDQLHLLDAENWKKNIKIQNIGENGVDLGGLRRNWFTKLSRALFNIDLGLFSLTENMTYQPSIQSYSNSNYIQLFKFAGAFIARAILQKEYIDVELTHSFLCNILDYKTDIEDLREIDESVYNSLQFILKNDLNEYEGLEFYFEIDHDNFGKLETFEFIENGSQIRVTNENKLEYVQYIINYNLYNSIECQLQKFYEGFDSLINFKYIKIFSPSELGLLISGRSEIIVDKIKKNATYEYPYTDDSPPVVLFFNSIEKWNQSDLAALMMFITGCPKAPVNGSVSINIRSGGDKTNLPGARTCFNILLLPYYENEEELNLKFSIALRENSFSLQ